MWIGFVEIISRLLLLLTADVNDCIGFITEFTTGLCAKCSIYCSLDSYRTRTVRSYCERSRTKHKNEHSSKKTISRPQIATIRSSDDRAVVSCDAIQSMISYRLRCHTFWKRYRFRTTLSDQLCFRGQDSNYVIIYLSQQQLIILSCFYWVQYFVSFLALL